MGEFHIQIHTINVNEIQGESRNKDFCDQVRKKREKAFCTAIFFMIVGCGAEKCKLD